MGFYDNMPRSLMQRRPPGRGGPGGFAGRPGIGPGGVGGPGMGRSSFAGGPGMGGGAPGMGGMGRLAQMNPGIMARLMRARSPSPQPQGQPMAMPQVPFQGGELGSGAQPPGGGAGPGGAGMPDFGMMAKALKGFQGMMGDPGGVGDIDPMSMDEMALEGAQGFGPPGMAAPGFGGGAGGMAGMDPAQMAGIMKMLPLLLAA